MEKVCKVCGSRDTTKWYEYGSLCKTCYNRQRYISKPKQIKSCQQCGLDFIVASSCQKFCCKECMYIAHKVDPIKVAKKRLYDLEHKHQKKDRNSKYFKDRLKKDLQFKLSCTLRSRLSHALKNSQKTGSAVKDLGCTIEELRVYLESKFQEGMSWDNYGFYGWHIDHIRPLASFDLSNPEELKKACHYTNLQPLWAEENLSKGDKI